MFKKGDTLIEVMLAIGVFSMVAISVVSVISSSSAGAEMNLETTLTREEIDAQADALRFIHTAAVADHTAADNRYYKLWQTITSYAVTRLNYKSEEAQKSILQYTPNTCEEAYTFSEGLGSNFRPFVINTRILGDYAGQEYGKLNDAEATKPNDVIITNDTLTGTPNKLIPTTTYPHLTFNDDTASSGLVADATDKFVSADGLYIVAVADPDTTYYVGGSSTSSKYAASYYDFYIRSCWYGINSNRASTISTVIRLHDPEVANVK